jgi:mono/diheme cytochrome c family protein
MKMRAIILAVTALLALVGTAGSGESSDGADRADAAKNERPLLPAPITLSSRPGAGPGERLFVEKCIMCHGPGGMGAGLLARRSEQPLLEKRTDLDPEFVIAAARMGVGNMPAISRGEVSDPNLDLIARYLARNKEAPR